MVQNDDEAWRAIVDNYGDRPDLETQVEGKSGDTDGSASDGLVDARPEEIIGPARPPTREPGWDELSPAAGWEQERFVPPPPPPLPTTTLDRTVAWSGLLGAPAFLLVSLVLGIRLPEILNYLMIIWFVGGFVYLVLKMNREPRDPDDNGAVL